MAALLLAPAALQAEPPPKRAAGGDAPVRHVILISVDGLRPDALTRLGPDALPHFYRFREEGAFTDNARTDFDYSNTLPNHLAQLTGRPVLGPRGHHWTTNDDPAPGETLHARRGTYVASVFDVAHDHGLRTAAYVSKSKFALLDQSYDARHGAPDVIGADQGRDKIDAFVYESDTERLTDRFVRDMQAAPAGIAFLHLRDPDSNGHAWAWSLWSRSPYMRSIAKVDALLGQVFALIEQSPALAGRTAVILTADHGGSSMSHSDAGEAAHYTVPFYVWGPGVARADLYDLNPIAVQNPETGRPGFDAPAQPIRNGSAANLALTLLGLPPVPGSSINAAAPLTVRPAVAAADAVPARRGPPMIPD